jgi:hypothetical protein
VRVDVSDGFSIVFKISAQENIEKGREKGFLSFKISAQAVKIK